MPHRQHRTPHCFSTAQQCRRYTRATRSLIAKRSVIFFALATSSPALNAPAVTGIPPADNCLIS